MPKKAGKQQFFHPVTGQRMKPATYHALMKKLERQAKEAESRTAADQKAEARAAESRRQFQERLAKQKQASTTQGGQKVEDLKVETVDVFDRTSNPEAYARYQLARILFGEEKINEKLLGKAMAMFNGVVSNLQEAFKPASSDISVGTIADGINTLSDLKGFLSNNQKVNGDAIDTNPLIVQLELADNPAVAFVKARQAFDSFSQDPRNLDKMQRQTDVFHKELTQRNNELLKDLYIKALRYDLANPGEDLEFALLEAFEHLETFAESQGDFTQLVTNQFLFFKKMDSILSDAGLTEGSVTEELNRGIRELINKYIQQTLAKEPEYREAAVIINRGGTDLKVERIREFVNPRRYGQAVEYFDALTL